ncbi:MAG TPA: helix-turn-helix domain-containing protein [Candidatus Acidoferrales bacterium]|nr:helix-turn-helix domain-containing protein [Candidatus Acidoferrales bacterium]
MSPRPVSHQVLDACLKYSWPGNVRELQNFVCRLLLREDEEELLRELSHTPSSGAIEDAKYQEPTVEHLGLKSLSRNVRSQAEKQIIEEMLARTCWNRTVAARLLKISYKSLRSKIQRYGITAMGHLGDTKSEARQLMFLGK